MNAPRPNPGWLVAKSLDRDAMTCRAVLTYPVVDRQGDFVRPDGGDWQTHKGKLVVNWEHQVPVGKGSVEFKSLTHGGKTWDVPVGTSRFFRTERDTSGVDLTVYDFAAGGDRVKAGTLTPREAVEAARDVFRLVSQGDAVGVSVEFNPDPAHTKALPGGRDYGRYVGRGWAHTRTPVNDHALLLLPDEPVVKAVRDKALCPVVLKAFARKLPAPATRIIVPRTVRKAMEDDLMPPDAPPPGDDMPPPDAPPPPDAAPADDTPPEISDASDAAQMVADLATRLKERAGKSLHAKTRKSFAKVAEKLEMMAEDLIAHAEDTEAELNGMPDAGSDESPADEPAADESDADGPDDDGPPEEAKALPRKLERDADGRIVLRLKSMTYKPRRLRLSELGEPTRKAKPAADADEVAREILREAEETRRQARNARRTR